MQALTRTHTLHVAFAKMKSTVEQATNFNCGCSLLFGLVPDNTCDCVASHMSVVLMSKITEVKKATTIKNLIGGQCFSELTLLSWILFSSRVVFRHSQRESPPPFARLMLCFVLCQLCFGGIFAFCLLFLLFHCIVFVHFIIEISYSWIPNRKQREFQLFFCSCVVHVRLFSAR